VLLFGTGIVVEKHECEADEWKTLMYPTDSADGIKVRCCKICGDVLDVDTISPCIDHTFGDYEITVEPSCEHIGQKTRVCSVCNKHEHETIPKIPHTEGDWVVTKEPMPFERGEKELHCAECGAVIKTESIAKTTEMFGLDSDERIITGFGERVTPKMLAEHYADMDITVTVIDADGNIPAYVGTDCKLFYEDKVYTIVVKGDMNSDGLINIDDLVLMQKITAGWNVKVNNKATDVNSNSAINIDDLILMQKYVAGWKIKIS
jgi:hypothetical protein